MPATSYFQLLNPLVFLLFAAAFFAMHRMRAQNSLLVLSISYFFGAIAFSLDIVNQAYPPFAGYIVTSIIYALCAALASAGVCLRYRGFAPWRALAVVTLIHIAIYAYVRLEIGMSWYSTFAAHVGCGVIFAVALFYIPMRHARLADKFIYALYFINTALCFGRPIIIAWLVGGVLTEATYPLTLFVATLHLVVGVCAITGGMALLVAAAIETIEYHHRQAVTDPLTGLLNRRGFEDEAAAILEAADRDGAEVGVIIADLDRFKEINDKHGHDFGDVVLAEFGCIFASYLDDGRIGARLGGEEFAMLLPGETGDDAYAVAEAVRKEFSEMRFQALETNSFYTVRVGAGS